MAGGKYLPLTELLMAAARRGESVVRLSFAELSALVGGLPRSAYHRRTWWGNGYLVQGKSWGDAGWRVQAVDLPGESVSFTRENPRS
ncbi:DUF7662 domain-containing protein [Actinophytocola algeriensis]|uniref:DUF7662 domain-containing protein n=1 Tax=Actinophytocola algeriensis TaxID=1768010 RepID=A0A7W7Q7Y2_9PSEU|nr:hypothetical protein [Actinophytocola algeriensis]MBB4908602.1 hypothetical protein [Actinophytocola algeriensis]MBE1475011.1 hypothetical protein [Actinophytocola algeriensis]